MAHDGYMGGAFHELAWPLAHAAGGAPFEALQVQVHHSLMGHTAGWDQDTGIGSLVSLSPSSLAAGGGGTAHDAVMIDELASRFGAGLGGSGGGLASPPSSRYASCYSTPVGSPSKPAPLFAADARLSCLAAPGGKLSRVASSQSLLGEAAPSPTAARGGGCLSSDGPSRKRKAPGGKSKAKDAVTTAKSREPETTRAKKCKLAAETDEDDDKAMTAAPSNGKGKDIADDPHKDYIHVRARRGQATDSHSLAERVRREKISERMKLLQDIVPGCNKVTGKAVMLDEIINYVQSLQHQVEFLSMKLATVNPRLEVDVDSFIPKDANQPCTPAASSLPPPPPVYSLEGSSPAFCYSSSPGTAVQSAVTSTNGFDTPSSFVSHGLPDLPNEGFQNANSQIGNLWEDDLQSLVEMGFRGTT